MISTQNGNRTISFDEFRDAVDRLVPLVDCNSLREAYDRISRGYTMSSTSIREAPRFAVEDAIRLVKREYQRLYRVVYIDLSYDCPPGSLCPQDCPHETLLINTSTGEARTASEIYEYFYMRRHGS